VKFKIDLKESSHQEESGGEKVACVGDVDREE